jgi:hypothetical protein
MESMKQMKDEINRSGGNLSGNETTYWGTLCRTCASLVAFDICPYISFGPGAASMTPGSIRCGHGHNHIYYPRDFRFFFSDAPISDAEMQENREIYRTLNRRPAFDSLEAIEEWDASSLQGAAPPRQVFFHANE